MKTVSTLKKQILVSEGDNGFHKVAYIDIKTRGVFGTSQTSKMGLFAKIINGFQSLSIFTKSSILDVLTGF